MELSIRCNQRESAFRGELTSHHPHFHPASPAAVRDIDIETAKQLLPNALTVGIHMGESVSEHLSIIISRYMQALGTG